MPHWMFPTEHIRSPDPWYQYDWISFYPGRESNPKRAPNKLGRGAHVAVFVAEIKKTKGWHVRGHPDGKRTNPGEKWKRGISKMLIRCVNTFSREDYCCAEILKNQWLQFQLSMKNKEKQIYYYQSKVAKVNSRSKRNSFGTQLGAKMPMLVVWQNFQRGCLPRVSLNELLQAQ